VRPPAWRLDVMRSAEARPLCFAPLALLCLLGCARTELREPPAPPLLAPSHYLDEPFVLGSATCRLVAAEPMLTEPVTSPPSDPQQALVAEDLTVIQARFRCEDRAGNELPFGKLGARLAWVDRARRVHVPSTRTLLGRKEPQHAVFELPGGSEGLLHARRFDAHSGQPSGANESGSARLYLEPQVGDEQARARARVVIAPWPRLHDRAFDSFLERLVRGLSRPDAASELATRSETEHGRAGLVLGRALYAQALGRGGPRQLSVHSLENVEGQARLTLALEPGPGGRGEGARLSFELTRGAVGQPVIARLLDPEGSKLAVACAARMADLHAHAERAREEASDPLRCNVLGELLPGGCEEVAPALRDEALFVGTRCAADGALGLLLDDAVALPSDLEVRLRRGRALAGLDQGSRYVVSAARSGVVHFEGQHRVSSHGASEGRTSAVLLTALWDHIARLGFMERPAPPGERCSSDERGDTISVRAMGRERSVTDRDGCRGGLSAQELADLRRAIERVAAVDAWIAPDLPVFSRDAEIWVVAAE
jgi:hypothetical protein